MTTAATSPIQQWKELAKATKRPTDQELRERAGVVREKIIQLDHETRSLLPTEAGAKKALSDEKTSLEKELQALGRTLKSQKSVRLSLEPLTWRNKDGWPQLIILGINATKFEISLERQGGYGSSLKITPKLPEPMATCYSDVIGRLMVRSSTENKTITLTSEFVGIFPRDIRGIIELSKKEFDEVFIIAEAQNWLLAESDPTPRPYDPCPLVVGWDGKKLWLIDYFDLTPVEDYVRREFSIED